MMDHPGSTPAPLANPESPTRIAEGDANQNYRINL